MNRTAPVALAVLCLAGLPASTTAAPARPNVVVFLADDLGYSDLGCYGSEISTPNLDRLAANGLRFTQAYNTARCWPSRAALLTGYYAQQVNRDPQGPRPKWAALLPDLLRPAGYRSYHSGKWHVDGPVLAGGFARSYHVTDHDRHLSPKHHQLDDRPLAPPRPGEFYYSSTAIADRAIEWIDEHAAGHKEDPFFLYVAFISPHFPLHAPAEDIARYKGRYDAGWDAVRAGRWKRLKALGLVGGELPPPEPTLAPSWNLSPEDLARRVGPGEAARAVRWDELTPEQKRFQSDKMAVHAAMVDRLDREVGRVLDRLKATGQYDNTLILFLSDNGGSAEQIIRGDGHRIGSVPGSAESYLGLGPGWSTVSNTPFRRHKSWTHEGGVSTPLIVQWPEGIKEKGGIRRTPTHLVDLVPTFLDLAGLAAPETWRGERRPALAGRSLVPAFRADLTEPRDAIFFKHTENRGLRLGDWKIVASGEKAAWELYDLSTDRGESQDLASSRPEKLKELADLWAARDAEYARQGATGRRPGVGKAAKAKTR
ncbi:MAG: arylsulfatase [Isosphaeraceae bacterium]